MKEIELFDGTVLEFPDETPDDVLNNVAKRETTSRKGPETAQPQQPQSEPNLLQRIDRAITPDWMSKSPFFQKATQFASGALEGAASIPALPFDFVRAAGDVAGVPKEYLPYGSQALNKAMSDVGVTQPDEGSGWRTAGNVAGSMAVPLPIKAPPRPVTAPSIAAQTLDDAGKAGLQVPRSNIKQTFLTNLGDRFGGKQAIEATAQAKNQPIYNKMAAKALGLSDDTPISPDLLKGIREEAGKVYDQASKLGTFTVDKTFSGELGAITKSNSSLAKEFPDLLDKGVLDLTKQFKGRETISSESVVEGIKVLRQQAKDNFLNNKTLARAQRHMADALEGLMERNISSKSGQNKEFLNKFREARTLIAKTYSVENALNPATGNVVGTELAKQAKRGAPLTKELEQIANFARAFPRLAREPTGAPASGGLFEPMVYGMAGGIGTQDPSGALAGLIPIVGKPLARHLMTTTAKAPKASKDLSSLIMALTKGTYGGMQPDEEALADALLNSR